MKLHNYFRSSASFRVRIALALKGLPYDYVSVHLARGEQLLEDFTQINGDALVPVLEVDGLRLTQSLAIIEYLEDTHPEPALLPQDPAGRARVRALAQSIACEIHPLNNLRVLKYLSNSLQLDEDQKNTWYRHWVDCFKHYFSAPTHRTKRQFQNIARLHCRYHGRPPLAIVVNRFCLWCFF